MPNVSVPMSFFVKERRMYREWQFAFWRELFQNSTDAKATRINVDIVKNDNGITSISFDDNGSGMSRQILKDVYFSLGATTKTGGGTVGGFGRARLLTCFSMKNYTIHTQDNLVQGEGGSYEIATVDYRQGCWLQVEIENESYDYLFNELQNYLRNSQMYCEVYVNGSRFTQWNYRRQLARQLFVNNVAFANVYVNKSSTNQRLLVRVSGAVMYSKAIGAKAQVIVEIEPGVSRDVLTANRDSMHSVYSEVLEQFIQELAIDTVSALKPRFKKKNATIKGRGFIFSISPKATTKLPETPLEPGSSAWVSNADRSSASGAVYMRPTEGATAEGNTVRRSAILDIFSFPVAEVVGGVLSETGISTVNIPAVATITSQVGKKYHSGLPDTFIDDDTENEKIRKVIDQYNPENWIVTSNGAITYNKGVKMYKLLMLWKVACQYAIDSLMKKHESIAQVIWGIGWTFSDTAEAKHMSVEGGSALLLNPVDKNGKLRYGINNQRDQKRLMALAKHEVAHILYSWHNEEYASLLTDIDELFDEREVYRAMREMISSLN
jgi:hypothetical protein